MTAMQNFSMWLLEEIPVFLMAEPIKYFTGIAITCGVIGLLRKLCNI